MVLTKIVFNEYLELYNLIDINQDKNTKRVLFKNTVIFTLFILNYIHHLSILL